MMVSLSPHRIDYSSYNMPVIFDREIDECAERDENLDILTEDIIPDAISEMCGVSRRAARIKLQKTGFVE